MNTQTDETTNVILSNTVVEYVCGSCIGCGTDTLVNVGINIVTKNAVMEQFVVINDIGQLISHQS